MTLEQLQKEILEEFDRFCEKLLNDFRNNRISYEKFIEEEEKFISQSIQKAVDEHWKAICKVDDKKQDNGNCIGYAHANAIYATRHNKFMGRT